MNDTLFWNGNKSPARRAFESELFKLALTHSQPHLNNIKVDDTDYPAAADESDIFNKGADALVTVAGNTKFADIEFIEISKPICKGLLGFRVMIVRHDDQNKLRHMAKDEIRKLKHGIPATWVDANLFRSNQFEVFEQGTLDTIFNDLSKGECDYIALGANEVTDIFNGFCPPELSLVIEDSIVLYYPMPLVFYVNPKNPRLAKALETGLEHCFANGQFNKLFEKHYGDAIAGVELSKRTLIILDNPELPASMTDFKASL